MTAENRRTFHIALAVVLAITAIRIAVLVASPLPTRWRNRFSTKIPWFGRAACGNSVENVSSPNGVMKAAP